MNEAVKVFTHRGQDWTNRFRKIANDPGTSIDPAKVKAMRADGIGPSAIAKALNIGRASVYRALEG